MHKDTLRTQLVVERLVNSSGSHLPASVVALPLSFCFPSFYIALPLPCLCPSQEQGSILAWVNDCFEEAAAEAAVQAAAARNAVQNQQQQQPQQQQPCTGMRRPLPLHTLLAVCDRRGAALRQQLADAAAGSVHACGGRLPLITRRYVLEGHELLSQQVAPREWLWAHWGADTHSSRVLRAREGRERRRAGSRGAGDGGGGGSSSDSDSDGGGSGGGSEDDVEVLESM